jgi:hypothetical protein
MAAIVLRLVLPRLVVGRVLTVSQDLEFQEMAVLVVVATVRCQETVALAPRVKDSMEATGF